MIVWRMTGQAKLGRTRELVEVIKLVKNALPNPDAMRIYASHPVCTPGYTVVTDIEFESLTALEQWLGEWFAKPESAEIMQQMVALQEPGGGSNIWVLQE